MPQGATLILGLGSKGAPHRAPVRGAGRGLQRGRGWLGIVLLGELATGDGFVSKSGPEVPQRDRRQEAAEPGHRPQFLSRPGQELGSRSCLLGAPIPTQAFYDLVQQLRQLTRSRVFRHIGSPPPDGSLQGHEAVRAVERRRGSYVPVHHDRHRSPSGASSGQELRIGCSRVSPRRGVRGVVPDAVALRPARVCRGAGPRG